MTGAITATSLASIIGAGASVIGAIGGFGGGKNAAPASLAAPAPTAAAPAVAAPPTMPVPDDVQVQAAQRRMAIQRLSSSQSRTSTTQTGDVLGG